MRTVAKIETANCYFRISDFYGEFADKVIKRFCKSELTKFEMQKIPGTRHKIWKPTHVFARAENDHEVYRLPASILKDFLKYAEYCGYHVGRIKMSERPIDRIAPITHSLREKYQTPREHQVDWIRYQLEDGPLKVNNCFTGGGKTYMALYTAVQMNTRALITVQPRYIPIWQKDIGDMFDVKPEDVVVWEYSDLARLGELIREGKIDPKFVILPTTRITTYLKNQRKDPSLPSLDQIFDDIGAGLRVIDEAHESFHEVAVSMMYGNPYKTILLSATLKADDPFLNKMYFTMIPKAIRLKEPDDENYIDIVAFMYDIDVRKFKVNTIQNGTYSDIAFEKSILANPQLLDFYFELTDVMYKEFYLKIKEEGTKCLFFFTMIEMCQTMREKFRERYPGEDFDTFLGTLDKKTPKKYLEHENLITTPGSCGTGKDIPGLVTTICPHTVFSTQRNKQIIGRLRNLLGKFGDRITPTFVFPVCKSIPKHLDCLAKRKISLASKQKTFRRQESGMAMAA